MTYVVYEEYEIQNLNGLLLHKNILQFSYNVDFTTCSFQILFKILTPVSIDHSDHSDHSCTVLSFKRKKLSQR